MAEARKETEIQDDGTDSQDLADEPTMPMVSTRLAGTEPRSDDDEWRMPQNLCPEGLGRPQIKPQRYDGTRSWTQYLQHFQRVSVVNQWSQAQ